MTSTPNEPSAIEKAVRERLEGHGFRVKNCQAASARGKPLATNLLVEVADGSGNGVFCIAMLNGAGRPVSFILQPRGEFGFRLFATVQNIIEKELM